MSTTKQAADDNKATGGNKEEQQYLDLVAEILRDGEVRPDRTGTGTRALFAPDQLRFSLADGRFPLLTTKRVFFRGVAEELFWFIRGQTDAKILQKMDIKIWDGNSSREYLDSIGLKDRAEGDLGPVYGFQWRYFGAQYVDCNTDYTGQGVDQLQRVIDTIKNNPTDRRMIVSAWNPAALKEMALPPCHMFCQFYVSLPATPSDKPKLSCLLYQRSCDMGLGVPFNIASYALLTCLVAHATGCEPHRFIHTLGDTHLYLDHEEPMKKQLERVPREFPRIIIKGEPGSKKIDEYTMDDIEIVDYKPYGPIKMKMSA